ncbi:MAG: sulfite oxidase-like oxidoreductase [Chloroflexi bacterium]|nr:MAG: sulfite oxidase-like oxidoreductase [Chloroflexota bacterium]
MRTRALGFRSVPDRFVTRGFVGRREPTGSAQAARIPPGQHLVRDFPVLSAGPTPRTPLGSWSFKIEGLVKEPASWSWADFLKLPAQDFVKDISCVTKWTKLDTRWRGVSVDILLEHVELDRRAAFVTAFSDGGYTTNIPLPDLVNGQSFVAYEYDGKPLAPEHGGPARLVVPHLYFWKSAKWVRGLRLMERDEPGFWESLGYNNHGDPWKEERYTGD